MTPERPPLTPADAIGRRRFLRGVAVGAGALSAVGGAMTGGALAPSGIAAASGLPAGASRFVPLPRQIRFADTRSPGQYPFGALPDAIRVQITGREGIPSTATAAVLTVTAVNRAEGNFVSVYPSGGQRPEVSNLNMATPLEAAANLATVRLGEGGAVDVYAFAHAELIVDVAGYYEPVAAAVPDGRFSVLPDAIRVIDTRGGDVPAPGSVVEVFLPDSVPAIADSVAINLTTTGTLGWGYFTCFPFDVAEPPDSSNLNVNGPGETRAAAAIVKVTTDASGRRGFKVFTYGGGHVLVDVAGYFTGPDAVATTNGLFVPVTPERILDTRRPGQIGRLWPRWVVGTPIPGEAATRAQAIVGNVTAVEAREAGYFTVFAANTALREVSNLNADVVNQTIANHFISRISTDGVAVFTQSGAHVLIDMAGWFTGAPAIPTVLYENPPPPAAAPPWRLEVPAMRPRFGSGGHVSNVFAGRADPIVDAGHTWHWTGTGYVGQQANVGLFSHRTEAGSPVYNMHELRPGDEVFVYVADRPGDRRRFRYRVVRSDMVLNVRTSTPANAQRILAATRLHPGTTVSIIGCALPNGLPTSLDHRLIVTAELVDWVEL